MSEGKIGTHCKEDNDCLNNNCIDGKCTRKINNTTKKTSSKKSSSKKSTSKKLMFSQNITRQISHLNDDLYFNDLDPLFQTLIKKVLKYDPDDDFFINPSKEVMDLPLMIDINILITRMKQLKGKVNSNDISRFAIGVLNNYIKDSMAHKKWKDCSINEKNQSITSRQLCMSIAKQNDYFASNIYEFTSNNKPLPKKFEYILLRSNSKLENKQIIDKNALRREIMNENSVTVKRNTKINRRKSMINSKGGKTKKRIKKRK